MSRRQVYSSGYYDQQPAVKEPLLTRSLASALGLGIPIGIIAWLALQQMPDVTWLLNLVMQLTGQ